MAFEEIGERISDIFSNSKNVAIASAAAVTTVAVAAAARSDCVRKVLSDVGDIAVECCHNTALKVIYAGEKEVTDGTILVSSASSSVSLRGREKEVQALFSKISPVAGAVFVASDENKPAGIEVTFKDPLAAAKVIKNPPPKGWNLDDLGLVISRGPFQVNHGA